jgi:hypothetical protein
MSFLGNLPKKKFTRLFETITTTENNNRGGQKGFSEAGRPTTSNQRSRLIVAFSEAFWMLASVNKIKKQKIQ